MRSSLLIGLILTILVISPALATDFSVSPQIIHDSIDLSQTTVLIKQIQITNNENTTQSVTVTSSNTDKVKIAASPDTIDALQTASITIIIDSQNQVGVIDETLTINVGGTEKQIPVVVSVTKPEENITEEEKPISVFPSGFQKTIVQGTETDEVITIMNVGDQNLDLSASLSGGITTSTGLNAPVYIKDFAQGELKPGEKRTLTVGFTTKGLEPGVYTSKILLQYLPGQVLEIPFKVTVSEKPQPMENKTLVIKTYPESNFKVGDTLYITTVDDKGKPVQAEIKVTQNDINGNKVKEFNYVLPFELEPGSYVITATAEGYGKKELLIKVEEEPSELKVYPSNPTTEDTITISYLDKNGNEIEGATIKIDGEPYTGPTKLGEGKHNITAEAPGYKKQSKVINVELKLMAIIPKHNLEQGEKEVIRFNKNVTWELRKNGVAVDYGTGNAFTFEEIEPGNYTIYANGELLGQVNVIKKGFEFNLGWISEYFGYILVIIGIIIVYELAVRRKPKKGMLIKDVRQHRGGLSTEKIKEEE